MATLSETKNYGTVQPVIVNEGESTSNLVVIGFLSPSENAPEPRILIGSNQLVPKSCQVPGFLISVKKWRELEALVNLACVDITNACPAHGDKRIIAKDANDDRTRPQKLRDYLKDRWTECNLRAKVDASRTDLADEAELVGEFLRWIEEAGLGR